MRYINLVFLVISFNIYAQVPDIPNIDIPDLDLSKLNLKLAKIDRIDFNQIDYSGPAKALGASTEVIGNLLSSVLGSTNNYHPRNKIVAAKPDATAFIVSDGDINSAYLEQALMVLRKEHPNASDMDLAKAILAY